MKCYFFQKKSLKQANFSAVGRYTETACTFKDRAFNTKTGDKKQQEEKKIEKGGGGLSGVIGEGSEERWKKRVRDAAVLTSRRCDPWPRPSQTARGHALQSPQPKATHPDDALIEKGSE
jgi:hypothetical protein